MRRRMVDPSFWTDSKIVGLSMPARLLYIGSWQYADDQGLFVVDLRHAKATLFPDQKFDIEKYWAELVGAGFFRMGTTPDGKPVAEIIHFRDYQAINRPTPSKLRDIVTFNDDSVSGHGGITECSLNPHSQVKIIKKKLIEEKTSKAPPPGFVEFWNAYPKKVGEDRCLKAWMELRISDELQTQIISAVKSWAAVWSQWALPERKYIPNPLTWLSGKRWKDELPAPRSHANTNFQAVKPEAGKYAALS